MTPAYTAWFCSAIPRISRPVIRAYLSCKSSSTARIFSTRMFVRDTSVSIKGSASSLCNNLTVLSSREKESVTYGVVHKAFVCITNVTKGSAVNQKQVSCKGEGAHSSSAVLQVSELAVYAVKLLCTFSLP